MEKLDTFQQEFCAAPGGNLRLLAPAGCGKTQCILYRCNYLAAQADPQKPRFLIVTFTRAARDELKVRINEESAFAALKNNVEITTLNSWGYRRVKRNTFNHRLIQSSDYYWVVNNHLRTIWQEYPKIQEAITERKGRDITKTVMELVDSFKSLGFDHIRHDNLESFVSHWEELIEQGLGYYLINQTDIMIRREIVDEANGTLYSDKHRRDVYKSFYRFWLDATKHLIDSAIFTLEDQKYYAYLEERKSLENGDYLYGAASYDHIMVDEFQDINPLDLALVKTIAERNRASISVVGDDDQAIFEWRGATPKYILNPESYFDVEFDTHKLGINYRSPANIVTHSQKLISHNESRIHKEITSHVSDNADIRLLQVSDVREALEHVTEMVDTLHVDRGTSERVALIGRKRSQIIPYQIYFASQDIPFCAAEDLSIFLSKTFEGLLDLLNIKLEAELRLSSNQVANNILSLCDLTKQYPIKKSERGPLLQHLRRAKAHSMSDGLRALVEYEGDLKGKNSDGKMSLEMAVAISEYIRAESITESLNILSNGFRGLQKDFGRADEDIFFIDPPFFYLADYAAGYGNDYEAFIADIETARDTLAHVPPEDDEEPDEVYRRPLHLMTAIRAKGKEFDRVILLDVEDGIWPSRQSRTPEGLEAERRVFYVGFTRAKKEVTMIVNKGAAISPYVNELGLDI